MTRSFRLPLFASLGAHGVLAVALAATSGGGGAPPPPPPGRVDASLHEAVPMEPDPELPPEALPLPEVPEAAAETAPSLEEPPVPEPEDERLARDPSAAAVADGNPWGPDGLIGLGPGGPPGRRGRALRQRSVEAAGAASSVPEAAAVPPAPGPTARARPVPGSCPAPDYPSRARRSGIEGAVEVLAAVDVRGAVASAEVAVSSGDASLDAAAVEAALRWRFEPALRDGVPVPDEFRVRFLFRLDDPIAIRGGSP